MPADEAEALSVKAIEAVKNKNTHMYLHHFIATGRKPLEE